MIDFTYISFIRNGVSCKQLNLLSRKSRELWLNTPGYSAEYLCEARSLIDVNEDYLRKNHLWTAFIRVDGKEQLFGFFSFKFREDKQLILDHFWVAAAFIGKGLGQIMFKKVLKICQERKWLSFRICSDVPAEKFYLKMGARRIGEIKSKIPNGPTFPEMEYIVGS